MLRRLFGSDPQGVPTPPPPAGEAWPLELPLMDFGAGDVWTLDHATQGVQIFGAIGSGKTSGSGATLARMFLAAGFGGLVLCAKPEERRLWERYAAETGRAAHLVIMSPDHPWRFNFLDYELKRRGRGGGLTENLVNLLASVMELVEGKQSMASSVDFWERSGKELLRNAIDIISLSGQSLTLDLLRRFITSAPQTAAQADDPAWDQHSFCAQLMREAAGNVHTPRQAHDFEVSANYWHKQYPVLGDRTRSSVVITVTSATDILQHGLAWELLGTVTNLVPEMAYRDGAILVLDLPVQEFGEMGRVVQGIMKYMFQKAILRREVTTDPRPVFLWADEAQNFISSFDYEYQATARSARGCTVYLTQNISNYYAKLGAGGRDQADSLLGNFKTQIFHANSSHPTNQYAADLIGQFWTTNDSYNVSFNEQGNSRSAGGSDALRYKLLPSDFTTLRTGGAMYGGEVDAIIFQGGRIWQQTGDTYLRASFQQSFR